MGVAACFDLDGKRQWMTRVKTDHLSYGSSPALADGILAVYLNQLYGLDAETGQLRWAQHRIKSNNAAVQVARLGGLEVFVTQKSEVIRPSDGKLLFRAKGFGSEDSGFAAPLILGDLLYQPRFGVSELLVIDFKGVKGEAWKPKVEADISLPSEINRGPGGKWIDRWTAGSPLVWQDIAYMTDIYKTLYAVDLKTRGLHYSREMDLQGFMHYNSVPIAASLTLVGKHILALDNQGTTIVLEPGPKYKPVGRNQIATQLDRWWPIPAQETLCYAPPVVDGNRLYLRGEAYLYCIGEK
jgi:outer membrane protein assembly factor BamB